MNKVTFIDVENPLLQTADKYAIIDLGNQEFISMPKSTYDEQQAANDTNEL